MGQGAATAGGGRKPVPGAPCRHGMGDGAPLAALVHTLEARLKATGEDYHMYDPRAERMTRDRLRALQLHRLQELLGRVLRRVPFYRQALAERDLRPDQVTTLDDLRHLPFTTRADLQAQHPFGFCAVAPAKMARFLTTAGTQGQPTLVGYTRHDLETWAGLCARTLSAAGTRRGDLLHITPDPARFGGLGAQGGAELLGCPVVPTVAGGLQRQIPLLRDLRPAGIKATPTYARQLADAARALDFNPRCLGLRYGVFGGEAWSEEQREEIQDCLGLNAFDAYGLCEMLAPGVAYECGRRDGLHVNEDHFLPEVIAPGTARALEPGEEGELVLTSLTREAFPLIRYRTGDRTALLPEPCPCGRTSVRIARVRSRV
jgi:phenylacetate-CoA ligase